MYLILIHSELNNFKTGIVCMYRSPGGNVEIFLAKLQEILVILQNTKKRVLIYEDFNIDLQNQSIHKRVYLYTGCGISSAPILHVGNKEKANMGKGNKM